MNMPDPTIYEPKGTRFYEGALQREMLLVNDPGHPHDGWLCWRHQDGQWVTERKATDVDRFQIAAARDRAALTRDRLKEPITEHEALLSRLAAAEKERDEAKALLRQANAVIEMYVREYVRHPEEHLKWMRGERHLCLSCAKAPPFSGCSALCPECLPPRAKETP